ncbi:hypothetical protein ACFYNY_23805 [Streptomyces sp. NPDC006530]|uniref:hypothetical protein n=1 Tax=Streptomyces sp. NPDC006530 TaxID=3364750 RepID=UPI0036ADFAB8
MGEFLRFAVVHGWVPADTTGLLSQPKLLRFTPPGFDTGESGQGRQVEAAVFRFKVTEPGYEDLSDEQIRRMIAAAPSARDRFLVALLACTGLRIGEALGLHRGDMHLLASSRVVGCGVEGLRSLGFVSVVVRVGRAGPGGRCFGAGQRVFVGGLIAVMRREVCGRDRCRGALSHGS